MSNCGSRPKKMKDGGAVPEKKKKKKKMPSGPIPMPQAVRNMRERSKSKGGAGEAGPGYVKLEGGGAAFPDLTGDGKVTKKDILRGRGVKGFEAGGAVCRGMGSAMRGGKYTGCK